MKKTLMNVWPVWGGKLSLLTAALALVVFSGCEKGLFEPEVGGTWTEINNTTDQTPTGCELVIDKGSGEVTLCGFNFVHPDNVAALFVKSKAKLYAKNGQIFYRQKRSSLLYLVPVSKSDLYFIDYDFEGQFLWIVGDNSTAKTTAKGVGKVFKRKS